MKRLFAIAAMAVATMMPLGGMAQPAPGTTDSTAVEDSALTAPSPEELIGQEDMAELTQLAAEQGGLHNQLKTKFVEGSAGFMSLVALALVLGLAFCIERIIYLTLADVDDRRLMADVEDKMEQGDVEGAKTLCRDTRGPVAAIGYQGLMHIGEDMATIERSVMSYGAVQSARLERGCPWIALFIAMAPSLGFLGTVIGMMMAFDQIQEAGDISPTIVASGMKVALITTIFGIIVALILQVFYNFILTKIEHLTTRMEESAITLLDVIVKHKLRQQHD